MTHLHLDFESASRVDLKKQGLDRYARHSSTRVLMLSWKLDNNQTLLWQPHLGPMPPLLRKLILDPKVRKIAHNAQFERAILEHVLKMPTPAEQWHCTMVMAMSLALPGKLEYLIRDALQLKKKYWKDARGEKLIQLFCYPSAKATWETHPKEWGEFCEYCIQDTIAEEKVYRILLKYVDNMDYLFRGWAMDQRINARGLPVDYDFIDQALLLAEQSKAEYMALMKAKTGLDNPNSGKQLLPWLRERGYPFSSLGKNRVMIAMNDPLNDIDPVAMEVLQLRLESNKTSLSKFGTLRNSSFGRRLRNTFQYFGAGATGRWAGRILGQNMPRPWKEVEDYLGILRDMIADGDLDSIKEFFGRPLECLSSSIRSAIKPARGKKLVVADLSSIELCVLAWLSGCKFWLEVIESGQDAYKAFAVRWLGVAYDKVTKFMRGLAKPPALGCFAPETKILTTRGWIPIIELRAEDLVFDGVEFVTHDGLIDQGRQEVIDMHGVSVTRDHMILFGENEWQPALRAAHETSDSNRATQWAIGLFSKSFALLNPTAGPVGTISASAAGASTLTPFGKAILKAAKASAAADARQGKSSTLDALFTADWVFVLQMLNDYQTGSTRCAPGASAGVDLTRSTAVEGSNVGSSRPKTSSDTRSQLKAGIVLDLRPTEETTTATTNLETFASCLKQLTTEISEPIARLNTKAESTLRKISTFCVVRAIEHRRRLRGKFERALLRSRSLTGKTSAVVRTVYDVANAGPRNRFAILTDAGPMIAHNCGYRLGPGKEVGEFPDVEKTGLWGYGANMGVNLTLEQCEEAVKVYREISPEIVQMWYDLENAAIKCVLTGEPQRVGPLSFDMKAPFLRMKLPTGRHLFYCRPRVGMVKLIGKENKPYYKQSLSYERLHQTSNKWVRQYTHGGKTIEQATQAIARELLEQGMYNAEAMGFELIGSYHDELLAEVDEDSHLGLAELIECMTRKKPWNKTMPVSADGYEGYFYRK